MLSYIETLGDYSKESMGIVSQMVSDFETGGGDMAWGLANAYGGALNKAKSGMQSKTYSVGAGTLKSQAEKVSRQVIPCKMRLHNSINYCPIYARYY